MLCDEATQEIVRGERSPYKNIRQDNDYLFYNKTKINFRNQLMNNAMMDPFKQH